MAIGGLPSGLVSEVCTVTTSVSVTTASVLIATTNTSRKGFIIWNNSSNSIYLSFAPTSSSSTCTYILPTFASWVYNGPIIYQGPISGIRNSGSGTVTLYELV
jgi:hypothetical protein